MDQLGIKEKVGVNYMLLEMTGAANSYTLTEMREKVFGYIIDTNVVFDMEQVTQLDSTGVGIIIALHNEGDENGTKVFVLNPSETVRHALERTGFYDLFHIIHSVTEIADE